MRVYPGIIFTLVGTYIYVSLCLDFITDPYNHQKIRNLIAMILVPKRLHRNDESQAAYLKAAVSRVSHLLMTHNLWVISN